MLKVCVSLVLGVSIGILLPLNVAAHSGDLDPAFGTGGTVTNDFFNFDDEIFAAAIQPDGKTVVIGNVQVELNVYRQAIVRYNLDGSFDLSFGSNGKTFLSTNGIPTIALQPDGKIIVGSSIHQDFALIRFDQNGNQDQTFGNGGLATVDFFGDAAKVDAVLRVAVQSDGKIVAVGYANSGDYLAVARLNANGTLDTSFGNGGKVTPGMGPGFEEGCALAFLANDKILVAGSVAEGASLASDNDFALVRFNADGQVDTSFGNQGKVITPIGDGDGTRHATDMAIQADGKIIIGGFASLKFALVRYNADGSLDATFGNGGKVLGPSGATAALVIQCDGKIVAADLSSYLNSDFRLVRYNSDGALDGGFGNQGVATTDLGGSDYINALALQPDCKLMAAGVSRKSGRYNDFALARYMAAATNAPVLQADMASGRALVLDSVTLTGNPFSVSSDLNFSADHRTRIMLFATNLTLAPNETFSSVTVKVEDGAGNIRMLPVEYVGAVPRFEWLTEVIAKLPDELAHAGTVQVSITHGSESNKGSFFIN